MGLQDDHFGIITCSRERDLETELPRNCPEQETASGRCPLYINEHEGSSCCIKPFFEPLPLLGFFSFLTAFEIFLIYSLPVLWRTDIMIS